MPENIPARPVTLSVREALAARSNRIRAELDRLNQVPGWPEQYEHADTRALLVDVFAALDLMAVAVANHRARLEEHLSRGMDCQLCNEWQPEGCELVDGQGYWCQACIDTGLEDGRLRIIDGGAVIWIDS